MPSGTFRHYNAEKGYGFIVSDTGEDVFVHASNIVGDGLIVPAVGEAADFDVHVISGGLEARNVRLRNSLLLAYIQSLRAEYPWASTGSLEQAARRCQEWDRDLVPISVAEAVHQSGEIDALLARDTGWQWQPR